LSESQQLQEIVAKSEVTGESQLLVEGLPLIISVQHADQTEAISGLLPSSISHALQALLQSSASRFNV